MATITNNPMSLGYLTVGAAPVSVIDNYPDLTPLMVNKVEFQANKANAGEAYVGYAGLDEDTGDDLLRVLQPGESWSLTHNVGLNVIPVHLMYVHGSTEGDVVLVVVHVA